MPSRGIPPQRRAVDHGIQSLPGLNLPLVRLFPVHSYLHDMTSNASSGPRAERTFRAMGTHAQVIVSAAGPADGLAAELADLAVRRVELLEQCWSRFRDDSELSRLNAASGTGPVAVSADLFTLVDHMVEAWQLSDGRFDPTVLRSMTALGYDADLAIVQARVADPADVTLAAAPGMGGIQLDPATSTITLPAGVTLDPGALGKGLAADLIVDEVMAAGAQGVLVNLGGDLAFAGSLGSDWWIGIDDERQGTAGRGVLDTWGFDAGTQAGVATSTTLKRRWAAGLRHHVIDPSTGAMADTDLVQVTICADRAWRAEALATAALLRSADEALMWLRGLDVTAVLCTTDRTLRTIDLSTSDLRGSHVG